MQNIFWKLIWEGSVWILMDPYGPVWVRMVPEDSLGASWGLLGPWGAQKGGFRVFGVGGDPPALGPAYALRGILTYMALWPAYGIMISCDGMPSGTFITLHQM